MTSYLDIALRAAQEGGAVLRDKLGRVSFREKRPADLVTEADEMSQRTISEVLHRYCPDHAFIGEESVSPRQLREEQCGSGSPPDHPMTWIVDPIDGTTNFVHQVPFFAVSIALVQGMDFHCGVIYNPILDECFTAVRGSGCRLNGREVFCSGIREPSQALTTFSFAPAINIEGGEFADFVKLMPHNQAMRRTGSTALNLAYLAAGRFDAVYCTSAHPWDVAAGALLVREAGGVISGTDGKPFDLVRPGILAAATPELHAAMMAILAGDYRAAP